MFDDEDVQMNEAFQARHLKTFIRVGNSFIDVKRAVGISFYRDPAAYVGVQFIFENGKALNAPLRNRNEFSLFLLELENFIDDRRALKSMKELMNEIENMPIPTYQEPATEQPKVDVPPPLPSEYENQFDPEVIKKLFNEFNKENGYDTSTNSNIS
jgi:hypothetical protein